jgi:hypothetical protein
MWFVLEALDPMPDAALMKAGTELIRGLRLLSPRCEVEVCLSTRSGSAASIYGCVVSMVVPLKDSLFTSGSGLIEPFGLVY